MIQNKSKKTFLIITIITLLNLAQFSFCLRYYGELKDIGDSNNDKYHNLNATDKLEEIMSRCNNPSPAKWETIKKDEDIPQIAEDAEHLCNKKDENGSFVVRNKFEPNSCWNENQDNWYQSQYEEYEDNKQKYKLKSPHLYNLFENPLKLHYSYASDANVHNFYSSFCGKTDQFPRCEKICIGYKSFYQREKKKIVHTVGLTAKVEWKVDESFMDGPYTGVFKHGSKNAIINITNVIDPKIGFKPSFALKFFRTNNRSSDLLVLSSGRARENLNFFAHGMSNMVAMPPKVAMEAPENWEEGIPAKQLAAHDPWFNMLGLSENGNNDETGRPLNIPKSSSWLDKDVKENWDNVKTPFRVFFEPTEEAFKACEDDTGKTAYKCFEKLEKLVGKNIYTIWGQSDVDTEWEKLGSIVLKSDFNNCPTVDKEVKFTHVLARREYGRQWMRNWQKSIEDVVAPFKVKIEDKKSDIHAYKAIIKAKKVEIHKKLELIKKALEIKSWFQKFETINKLKEMQNVIRKEIEAEAAKILKCHDEQKEETKKMQAGIDQHKTKIENFRAGWEKNDTTKFVIDSVDAVHDKIKAIQESESSFDDLTDDEDNSAKEFESPYN